MASATSLSEPEVLAHTKRRLFPGANQPDTYSVVDTQFTMEEWLPASLVDHVELLHVLHPTFTVELFVQGTRDVRSRVLDGDGGLRLEALREGDVFHSPTVFQLKAMLYHAGILTERGVEPHRLDPETDVCRLCESLSYCR